MTAEVVHKINHNSKVIGSGAELSIEECERIIREDLNPIFTEDQMNVLVSIISNLRQEFDDKLPQAVSQFENELNQLRVEIDMREEMAEQRGQLKVVTSILGISDESKNKTIDVSEVIRKIKVQS